MTIELSDVTAQHESALTNGPPWYDLRLPDGGSGLSGLSIELIDGAASHGNTARITLGTEYSIQPKAVPYTRFFQQGGTANVDNVAQSVPAVGSAPDTTNIWGGVSGDVTVDDFETRHQHSDRHYLFKSDCDLSEPQPWSVGIDKNEAAKLCYFEWRKVFQVWNVLRHFAYTSITGTFNWDSNRFTRGEICDLETGDGTSTRQVYVTRVNDSISQITVEPVDPSTWSWGDDGIGTSDFYSGTLTGTESGAVADIGTSSGTSSSVKHFRFSQDGERDPGAYLTYGDNGGGQFFNGATDASGNDLNDSHIVGGGGVYSPTQDVGQWVLIGVVADYSGSNSRVYLWGKDGWSYTREDGDVSGFNDNSNGAGMEPRVIQLDDNTGGAGTSCATGDYYVDTDTRFLMITDASTISGSTQFELQRISDFQTPGDGSAVIDIELNEGAHSGLSGKYIHLLDGANPIFEGLEVPA